MEENREYGKEMEGRDSGQEKAELQDEQRDHHCLSSSS